MANTKIKNTVLDSSVISGQSTVTAASDDLVLIQDVSDSNNLKKALVSDFGSSFAGIDDQSSSNDDQLTITDSAVIINEDSDDVDFRVEGNGDANLLFVNAGDDRVGIKQSSPLYELDVNGEAYIRTRLFAGDGTASSPSIRFYNASTGLYHPGSDALGFVASGAERARIDSSGNAMFGSTAVFENERVNIKKTGNNDDAVLALDHDTGDASFYRFVRFYKKNANTSVGKIDYDNSGDAMTLAVESDERYKTITGPADGMNLISKLEPIKYTRPAEGVTDGCGFGAQSYKQAFDDIGAYPRGLTVGSDTEKWMLDYSPLVPNLVKAIQELEARIAELEAKLEG